MSCASRVAGLRSTSADLDASEQGYAWKSRSPRGGSLDIHSGIRRNKDELAGERNKERAVESSVLLVRDLAHFAKARAGPRKVVFELEDLDLRGRKVSSCRDEG